MWISNIDSVSRSLLPGSRGEQSTGFPHHRGHAGERVSPRARRRLVGSLRRLADRQPSRHGADRRFEVLLLDRVALVRRDLLEIAALLEDAREPDPDCLRTLHRLLTDGCERPLYNPDVHPSELRAALYYTRSRLAPGSAG